MAQDNIIPLAQRLRPQTFEEFIGQEHIMGEGKTLRRLLLSHSTQSLIFYGPCGCGKTTLATLIAKYYDRKTYFFSGITSTVADIRKCIEQVKKNEISFAKNSGVIMIMDEIHHLSRTQQEVLLDSVEKGDIMLIGLTTENPSLSIISALLSRCMAYELYPLGKDDVQKVLLRAAEYYKKEYNTTIQIEQIEALERICQGDARKLLNIVSTICSTGEQIITINDQVVMQAAQKTVALYDKSGDNHYNLISAYIKSLRQGEVNAAVYYLARMIVGGEDPLFIARRMIIFSSEDIGMANPNALLLATSCYEALSKIGMPEGEIVLSHVTIYLALSEKSNASYLAIDKAKGIVKQTGNLPVPKNILNAPTKFMKEQGYGAGYVYPHDNKENFQAIPLLPEELKGTIIYDFGYSDKEKKALEKYRQLWQKYYNY